jgi:arsenical pump membrane protein
VIGPAFALGLEPWTVALAAAVLVAATAWRASQLLRNVPVPWLMAGAFAMMTLVVNWAHDTGRLTTVLQLTGTGTGTGDLMRLAGVTRFGQRRQQPAGLPRPRARRAADPVRLMAILIGANTEPLITPWASLATLLWLQRCRAAGIQWRRWRLALAGLGCAAATVTTATLTLALLHR